MFGPPPCAVCLKEGVHNYTPAFLGALVDLWDLFRKGGVGRKAAFLSGHENAIPFDDRLIGLVITGVEDLHKAELKGVNKLTCVRFKEFIETGSFKRLEEMRGSPTATIAHNYTPDFLEALEELIELYQARALKSKKAAFRSSVWREEMRTLEWKVITRVEDIDSDTWESDLGLGRKFKEFIETGKINDLEEMRGSPTA